MTKMGPNNASGIVWAISEFFLLFSFFFGILTNVYSIYIESTMYIVGRVVVMKTGLNDVWCCLGPRWVSFVYYIGLRM